MPISNPPRKFMDDYNYHDWSKFMVQKKDQKPSGPHFAAVLLETRRECTPAYDANESPSYGEVPNTVYFAFPDTETLEAWVSRATKAGKDFFFFKVERLGKARIQVEVDYEESGPRITNK